MNRRQFVKAMVGAVATVAIGLKLQAPMSRVKLTDLEIVNNALLKLGTEDHAADAFRYAMMAAQREINPPVFIGDGEIMQAWTLKPGALNYVSVPVRPA